MKIDIKKIDFVIFDCDGVILDSNSIKTDTFRKILKKYPNHYVDKLIAYHKENGGISRKLKLEFFYKEILKLHDPKLVVNSLKAFEITSYKKLLKSHYIKGVLRFIRELKKNKIDLFIVSGALENELNNIFEFRNKKKLFKEILGTPYTKEENINKIFKKYSLYKKKGIFFGDSKIDLLTSKIFKIEFIFVTEKSEWIGYKRIKRLNKIINFEKLKY